MHINLSKISFGLAAIAGILAASGAARAADLGDCAAYNTAKPHLYVAGSSAIKPFATALSTALADDKVIVYVSQGSCVGVDDVFNNVDLPTGAGAGLVGADTCTLPAGTKADIGVSDVFAPSCDGVDALKDGFGDFYGPVQIMNFVVPKGGFDNGNHSISAEAAYLVFGFDPSSDLDGHSPADGTPYTSKSNIWVRGAGSGTQSMLAAAINVPPGKWPLNDLDSKAQVTSGSGGMVTAVGTATELNKTIGILASTELDDHRDTIRGLAFQGYGQSCGYWPDSTSSSTDKLNVRNGKYQVWGPLHMFAEVKANGDPKNAEVAEFIAYVNGTKTVGGSDPLAIVKTEISKNTVPQCAMQVSRDEEVGNMQSVNPTCTCFYENVRLHGDDGESFDSCTKCTENSDCSGDLKCSYGYCEAI
jgi:ABC-type phosphate transport system substrate-binding protein